MCFIKLFLNEQEISMSKKFRREIFSKEEAETKFEKLCFGGEKKLVYYNYFLSVLAAEPSLQITHKFQNFEQQLYFSEVCELDLHVSRKKKQQIKELKGLLCSASEKRPYLF